MHATFTRDLRPLANIFQLKTNLWHFCRLKHSHFTEEILCTSAVHDWGLRTFVKKYAKNIWQQKLRRKKMLPICSCDNVLFITTFLSSLFVKNITFRITKITDRVLRMWNFIFLVYRCCSDVDKIIVRFLWNVSRVCDSRKECLTYTLALASCPWCFWRVQAENAQSLLWQLPFTCRHGPQFDEI